MRICGNSRQTQSHICSRIIVKQLHDGPCSVSTYQHSQDKQDRKKESHKHNSRGNIHIAALPASWQAQTSLQQGPKRPREHLVLGLGTRMYPYVFAARSLAALDKHSKALASTVHALASSSAVAACSLPTCPRQHRARK